jgi:hypothetical protein
VTTTLQLAEVPWLVTVPVKVPAVLNVVVKFCKLEDVTVPPFTVQEYDPSPLAAEKAGDWPTWTDVG